MPPTAPTPTQPDPHSIDPAQFDALWDYDRLDATEAHFRIVVSRLPPGSALHAELQTQIARTYSLRRRFDEAHAILDEVLSWLQVASEAGDAVGDRLRIRYLLERGRTLNSAGEPQQALPLFQEAFELARACGEDNLAVDAAHMVAIAEAPERRVAWNLRALELATTSPDPIAQRWQGSLYNNLGWEHFESGDFDAALRCFEKALAFRESIGRPGPIRIARWSVAKALRSLGRIEEALAIQTALLAEFAAEDAPDGYVHQETAECLQALGRTAEAAPHFAEARRLLSPQS